MCVHHRHIFHIFQTDSIVASADRRPVDPPPIVELRIYEGDTADKEITFQLSANYFLFATLEPARPIAQGRSTQDANRLTVLTGTPVAGMVYLDRPSPAGYFIFPDLSVRHEGKYRLSFNLYEELKENKDDDQVDDEDSVKAPGIGDAHVTHRLEVRSQPFTVFSAKKFPGLASSTNLSRVVAEQGCRVRIRRDVRMRKRDGKPGKEGWDEYEEDTGYDRARQPGSPDPYANPSLAGTPHMVDSMGRPRSSSISSHHSHHSLAPAALSRRPSMQEMAQMYQQQGYPPPPQQITGHPAQGGYTQSPYAPPHSHSYSSQVSMPAPTMQPSMPPPQPQLSPYGYGQPAPAPSQQAYYGYAPPAAPRGHPFDNQQYTRHGSMDYTAPTTPDYRRSSMPQPSYSYPAQHHAPQTSHSSIAPPIEARQPTPSTMTPQMLPPLTTSLSRDKLLEATSPLSAATGSQYYEFPKHNTSAGLAPPPVEISHMSGTKRPFDNVFDTRHITEPLRQKARPDTRYDSVSGHSSLMHADVDDTPDDAFSRVRLSYKRADGRETARPLPPSHD